ncbi:MAG: 2-oxo acid dehydrogenase subunit E2 [Chitinophagaceae bacterium]|nr:2-oxo acid dehydrogenase subunit E2 [Chitinophagaceae bacterium]
MPIVDLVLPKLGESIMEATILKWHKSVGDIIQLDETLLDIATDKVDSEIPSTVAGKLIEILYEPNAVVPIGTVIARIECDEKIGASTNFDLAVPVTIPIIETATTDKVTTDDKAPTSNDTLLEVPFTPTPTTITNDNQSIQEGKFYSPLVMNIAQNEGIPMQELQQIKGTGNQGRVSKKDILNYIANKKTSNNNIQNVVNQPFTDFYNKATGSNNYTGANFENIIQDDHLQTTAVTGKLAQPEDVIITGHTEIIEMDRMRKVIAKHMIDSAHTSAHVTSFVEADVTNMVVWREKVKQLFEKREGVKLTFTPMFIECIASVMEKFPIINSSLTGDQIILKKDINIGMATALPSGNLIVPVIKGANQLSIVGLSKAVNTLANNARLNQLKPADTQDGTFTVTNVGSFGSIMGTPLINQPQVAIIALGAIKKRPVVIETPSGDAILVRHMMYLSMSYDHRIVDGAIGSQFLSAVAKAFEAWDPNRQWFQYL